MLIDNECFAEIDKALLVPAKAEERNEFLECARATATRDLNPGTEAAQFDRTVCFCSNDVAFAFANAREENEIALISTPFFSLGTQLYR